MVWYVPSRWMKCHVRHGCIEVMWACFPCSFPLGLQGCWWPHPVSHSVQCFNWSLFAKRLASKVLWLVLWNWKWMCVGGHVACLISSVLPSLQIMREIQEHKIKIYEFPETDDEEENKLVKKIKVCTVSLAYCMTYICLQCRTLKCIRLQAAQNSSSAET